MCGWIHQGGCRGPSADCTRKEVVSALGGNLRHSLAQCTGNGTVLSSLSSPLDLNVTRTSWHPNENYHPHFPAENNVQALKLKETWLDTFYSLPYQFFPISSLPYPNECKNENHNWMLQYRLTKPCARNARLIWVCLSFHVDVLHSLGVMVVT